MGRGQGTLLHLPFFEVLGGLTEDVPEWRATKAGLVTLRLFDSWVADGWCAVEPSTWTARAVRESVREVESPSVVRSILTSVLDAMESSPGVRVAVVAPRLMAYGRALQFEGRWSLAADVYRTVIAHAHPIEDADVVVPASLQLGASLRMLAEWTEAAEAYSAAGEIAALTGDLMNVLRSRVSEGNLAIDRGNLPRAETILEGAIAEASAARFGEVHALALHARAHVAHMRRDFELAVRLAYEALDGLTSRTARDRVLSDIATSFLELGVRSAARDAYLVLAATAQEQYMRWLATVNLMELAALDRVEPTFEQYRRELADAPLPVTLAAHYYFYVGQGYRLFGRPVPARAALGRAVEVAAANQLNQLLFDAESSLKELARGGVPAVPRTADAPASTAGVADAVRDMRRLAGVGA